MTALKKQFITLEEKLITTVDFTHFIIKIKTL